MQSPRRQLVRSIHRADLLRRGERESHGKSFVVEAMVSNPDAALAPDSITDLVVLGNEAFGLLARSRR
jgi:hypothetical protein